MNSFKDRENAFEAKFAHDAEMQFKANARRNKLLGLWVAGELGLTETEAEDYALEVIRADFEEPGDEDVFRKVAEDLGKRADAKAIRDQMAQLLTQAKAEVLSEAD